MGQLYDEYLYDHTSNVRKAFEWLIEHKIITELDEMPSLDQIDKHDLSKNSDEEYDAYDRYFYGNKSYKVTRDFNYAWLHHIHSNPHHWQYWVLQHDDEPEEVLEMPKKYAIEMICDWWSFSWKTGKLDTIFDWYENHKGMKLNPATRTYVEGILDKIKKEIYEEDRLEHHGVIGQKWGVRNGPPYPIKTYSSPEDLFEHMQSFKYKNFDRLMSSEEVEKTKSGSCHDQTLYEMHHLRKMGKHPKGLFFIEVDNSGQGGTTHSLAYFIENGKAIWFENSWKGQEGIHVYDSLTDLKKAIKRLHVDGKTGDSKRYNTLVFGEFNDSEHKIGEDLQDFVDISLRNS